MRRVKYSVVGMGLALAFLACTEVEPQRYEMRETVQIAEWDVRILHREFLSPNLTGLAQVMSLVDAEQLVAIHVALDYERGEPEDHARALGRLLGSVSLSEADGRKRKILMAPLTQSHFLMLKSGSSTSLEHLQSLAQTADSDVKRGRWVLVYPVSGRRDSLSFVMRNYDAASGQPRRAAIMLRR
jgi:hypothetical protein